MLFALLLAASAALSAQSTGAIAGVVSVSSGKPVHYADVVIVRSGQRTESDEEGKYRIEGLAPGPYDIVAHLHGLTDSRRRVEVRAGATVVANFELNLSPVRDQLTVTASGRQVTPIESFLSITSASQLDLAAKAASSSLGDLLEDQPGLHKRSFGPGTGRPVVRGFDGDRVLVLQDGIRTGTLSSQSGDHGEAVDSTLIERVEVVRGPATLLYGSNAIGAVINTISPEHEMHSRPRQGLSGNVGGTVGSANQQGGGSGNFRYGIGGWQIWAGGGSMRTGDYKTPIGTIDNSGTNLKNMRLGVGRYSEKASFSFGYSVQDGNYGVPFAGEFHHEEEEEKEAGKKATTPKAAEEEEHSDISLGFRRHQFRVDTSVRDLGRYFEQFRLKVNYTDWNHEELEGGEVGTDFFNKQLIVRGDFEQRRWGRWSGTVGFWGMRRDYKVYGEEALAPPVGQNALALFAVEEYDLERLRFQFGARFERNSYDPEGLTSRSFNGLSASAGINVPLWAGGAFVTNFTHSLRAPALEELYNRGPHIGNFAYEIGNQKLEAERSNGIDLSLRHQGKRLRGEANFFHYGLRGFIYGAPTGKEEDGLPELEYEQGKARFTGTELKASTALHEKFWLHLGLDAVRARLTEANQNLPRIPPVRGRIGVELLHRGLSVRPELVMANQQNRLFPTETRTAGYVVPGLTASYSIARQHVVHVFTCNVFNIGNVLYRNHLSFIKEVAPEMGRGVRFSYNVHFY